DVPVHQAEYHVSWQRPLQSPLLQPAVYPATATVPAANKHHARGSRSPMAPDLIRYAQQPLVPVAPVKAAAPTPAVVPEPVQPQNSGSLPWRDRWPIGVNAEPVASNAASA